MRHASFGLVLVCGLHAALLSLHAQSETARGAYRIMWYNVENLFHPSDDSLAGDDEFTPHGVRHWTWVRYRKKLTNLARVIVASGQWQTPGLVGLCEIENAQVLEDLVSHPILEPFAYGYFHRESPDHRGMDIACLFREQRFHPDGWETISPVQSGSFGHTREVLHVWGRWGRRDTMDLFLCHFISRYRGTGITAEYRRMQSASLVLKADSVQRERPGSLVVLAGDFNEPWEGYSLGPFRDMLVGATLLTPVPMSGQLTSYKYRGIWSGIDQFLIGGNRVKYRISGSVFSLPALLAPDEDYGGLRPFRTYNGFTYTGGYSDHLPILLDLSRSFFQGGSGR